MPRLRQSVQLFGVPVQVATSEGETAQCQHTDCPRGETLIHHASDLSGQGPITTMPSLCITLSGNRKSPLTLNAPTHSTNLAAKSPKHSLWRPAAKSTNCRPLWPVSHLARTLNTRFLNDFYTSRRTVSMTDATLATPSNVERMNEHRANALHEAANQPGVHTDVSSDREEVTVEGVSD